MSAEETTDPYVNSAMDAPPGESPSQGGIITPTSVEDEDSILQEEDESTGSKRDLWLLQRAQEIYTNSTDYMDANITQAWETSLSHFNNEHASSSRYRRNSYKRSSVFRPKTRANTKNQEANMAAAAFSTHELVDIQPVVKSNPEQIASAKVMKSLLQHRLSTKMPWFLTVMGAYQDTKNYGVCITHQYWSYKEDTDVVPAFDEYNKPLVSVDPETGEVSPMGFEKSIVRDDSLHCDNVAPENFRFDPMCDWRDPVNTSPYLVYLMPTYVDEALEMMETEDPKTNAPTWKKYTKGEILATRRQNHDRTRQAREGRSRIDPADENAGNGYTTVWAHMNIIRVNGDDVAYWTMGTELLLTQPQKLVDLFPHLLPGQRPFTLGFANIETHKNYPAGDNELTTPLQEEINEVANQRLDNVKLALNKRYYVKRGAQVDLDALMRNVSGGGVMMNDPEKDVKTVDTRDVTASSYREQEMLSSEVDELVGGFNPTGGQQQGGSPLSNGQTEQAAGSAGAVQDYSIRIFMETWMEPALRQMVQLIQMYETDEVLLAIAAEDADLLQKYGTNEVTDSLLQQMLSVGVNVGIGNTDPVKRVEKLVFGVTKAGELPGMMERIKGPAISDEIFGALGYKDSSRFFMNDEEYAKEIEENPPGPPPEIAVKQEELRIREEDNRARHQREMEIMGRKDRMDFARLALEEKIKLDDIYNRLGVEKMKDETTRDAVALRERNKLAELNMKRAQGGK